MSMDQFVSAYYNQGEDLEKEAQVELFAKLAAANGIDLEQLSEGQIAHLWNETFKTASDGDEDEDEKKRKAEAEHEEKKTAAAKIAEADYLGRQMARSMIDELQKQAADGDKSFTDRARDAGKAVKNVAGKAVSRLDELTGTQQLRHAWGHHKMMKSREKEGLKELAEISKSNRGRALKSGLKRMGATGAIVGGTVAAGAGLKHLYDKNKEKKSSALDDLAAEAAIYKAASVGWDMEEAMDRIHSVLTLGVEESEKIAFVQDLDSAVEVRSLELLEAAGYPVTWQ